MRQFPRNDGLPLRVRVYVCAVLKTTVRDSCPFTATRVCIDDSASCRKMVVQEVFLTQTAVLSTPFFRRPSGNIPKQFPKQRVTPETGGTR